MTTGAILAGVGCCGLRRGQPVDATTSPLAQAAEKGAVDGAPPPPNSAICVSPGLMTMSVGGSGCEPEGAPSGGTPPGGRLGSARVGCHATRSLPASCSGLISTVVIDG